MPGCNSWQTLWHMASARFSGRLLAMRTPLLVFWTIECLDRMERDKVLLVCQVAKIAVPLLFYHVRLLVDCLVYIVPDICVCICPHGLHLFSRGMILQATAFLVSTCYVCDMVTAAMLCVWLV